jgi:sterol desaturase/sphingolipid hydroxylase (fatty acid hydroxylase superfamily)
MVLLQIVLAYLYSHVLEYYVHKFLHRFKKKGQLLSFHLRAHHVNAKKHMMLDRPSGREALYLGLLAAAHSPLLLVAPWAFGTLVVCSCMYLYVHNKSHLDPEWGKKHVPWHVDHHLGNQQANWGVRRDWVDKLLGTRDASR